MNILDLKRKAHGWHFHCSDSPDMSGANRAAEAQAALSKEQLEWAKQIYAESAPERAAASARGIEISDAQLEAQKKQTALTDEYADYNRTTFRPLEQSIVDEATAYDTPERREAQAAKATADVEMSLAAQRGISDRNLERSGVMPGSGKALALQGAMDIGAAKLKAGAASQARTQVETIGAAKKADAANLGRNLASNQATSAGIALNQGNSSVSNSQVPGAMTAQGNAIMNSGFSGAQQGLSSAASTYGAIAKGGAGDDSAMWSTIGQIGGAALMAFSDVNMKENIEPVDPDAALESVEKTPVATYNYEAGSPGAKDAGTEKTVGPMAQDVKKTMGAKTAPGGKKINLIAMNGITMAAVQALSKKVDRVMAAQGLPA